MQNRIAIPFLLFGLFIFSFAEAQVKIGDNPQVIDPASILELESSDKVLVITRVDSLQMTTIVPNRGALVYNTTADCVFYYDGTEWINMCGTTELGENGPLTAAPIVNDISTIVITPTLNGANFEVAPNSINSEQIVNGGINGVDIQDGSIGQGKLQDNSVTQNKLSENSVGAFALDNDNVDLGDFTNNAGFITGADIISPDPGNVITDSNGAFYDDSGLQTAIAANTAAIAADGDTNATNEIQNLQLTGNQLSLTGATGFVTLPTADGSDTQINAGNNITISGNGTAGTPYIINTPDQADPSITNELQDLAFDPGTNILTLTNPATATNQVDLSTLAGGGGATVINDSPTVTVAGNGTPLDPYLLTAVGGGGDDNQTAAEVPVTATPVNYTAATQDVEAHLAGIDAALIGGGDDNQTAAEVPFTATGNTTSTDVQNAIVELQGDIDGLSSGGEPNTASDGGTGGIGLTLPKNSFDLPFKNINVGDSGIIGITDDTANNEIDIDIVPAAPLTPAENQMLITNGTTDQVEWAPLTGHTGTAKGIFFADATGNPVNPMHPTNGNLSLIWDNEARVVGPFAYGALGIGLDGNPISGIVKTHIEDIVIGDISYPLQIQNRSNTGATGIVFSVIGGSSTHGKGVLAFERNGTQGIGDFHFLQDTDADNSTAGLDDKSFSILSNKDIQLYGNLIARNGAGTNGQVLTTNAAGETVWGAGGGGGTITDTDANDGLNDFSGTAGYNINVDDATIEIDTDALRIKDDGITTAKILDGEIQTNDIADANVTLAKIQPLTPAPATDQMLVTTTAGVVAWAPVTTGGGTTELADQATITGDGQLGTEFQVADAGIKTLQLDNNAVTSDKIADANVTLAKIEPLTPAPATDQMLVTTTAGAVAWAPVSTGSNNLENTNLVQTDLVRTYELTTANHDLVFTGLGNVGIGNGANPPSNKLHVAGAIRSQGILNSNGSMGEPSYRFNDDTDTGMFREDADELVFVAGGIEGLRIDEASNQTQTTVAGIFELDNQLLDITNVPGTSGQILSSTGTGVQWIPAPSGGGTVVSLDANNSIIAGGDTGAFYEDPDDDPNNEIELPTGGASGNVLSTDGAGTYSWIAPSGGGTVVSLDANNSIIAGGDTGAFYEDPDDDPNNEIELPTGGASGNVLSTDGAGTYSWIAPGGATVVSLDANNSIIAGGDTGAFYEDPDDDPNNEIELPTGGATGNVLSTDGAGTYSWIVPASGPISTNTSIFSGDGTGGSQLDIVDNGIEPDLIEGSTIGGDILTTDASGDVVWAAPTSGPVTVGLTIEGNGTPGFPLELTNNAVSTLKIFDGAVISSKIADGTITDVDISGTADIDGSKIVPNFNAQITTTAGLSVMGDVLMNGFTHIPDYVFQKYYLGSSSLNENYNFKSLEEIEVFIKKYHHLPGITSAAQAKEEGSWNLSASNLQNLEKIEELYLHTINQEKEINKLKSEKETLSKELQTIKKDLEEIKSLLKKSE